MSWTEKLREEKWLGYVVVVFLIAALAILMFLGFGFFRSVPPSDVKAEPEPLIKLKLNDLSDVPEYGAQATTTPPIVEGQKVLPGDWYALELSDGGWRVVKVLKTDNSSLFIAAYYDQFEKLLSPLATSRLEKGYEHDVLPIAVFTASKPHFLKADVITNDEFKAYQMWQIKRRGP